MTNYQAKITFSSIKESVCDEKNFETLHKDSYTQQFLIEDALKIGVERWFLNETNGEHEFDFVEDVRLGLSNLQPEPIFSCSEDRKRVLIDFVITNTPDQNLSDLDISNFAKQLYNYYKSKGTFYFNNYQIENYSVTIGGKNICQELEEELGLLPCFLGKCFITGYDKYECDCGETSFGGDFCDTKSVTLCNFPENTCFIREDENVTTTFYEYYRDFVGASE